MTMLSQAAAWFVRRTRPYARALAYAYGVRLDWHCEPTGQHPLQIEGGSAQATANIPRSVRFNTRSGAIFVGRDTVFGEDVQVLTGKHLALWEAERAGVPLHHVPESGREIRIGRGCYIGTGAILIGPLVVGDHAVIGAGSVVTHDVPPRTFVAGVPARVIQAHVEVGS
ncbi:MAG: hypothetical protein HOQ17_02880 [Gemmatimonadaceae bacterium]|nr:hypothetical protein [Gemmatimonadaceae bacterium]NUO93183.1 hypothetical protein [Gemmatimonadaceae bacterium]NUP54863.1 hypothetical protein [Gemmatimonadaceae bacterium]NUP71839.1 hypothetical protein [Gemmatimonadaceae bacterium]NUR33298.1 hypothetical protein [Gemmatimonadaceae bacterium]